jgi:hypothetical protein
VTLIHTALSAALLLIASVAAAASVAQGACRGNGYTYAGMNGDDPVAGVAARITLLSTFDVLDGHVAAYVGVGGAREGPNGTTEWIQVGLSAFDGIVPGHRLYYEIVRPNGTTTYHEVLTSVSVGEMHRVAVYELANRRNWWRVQVDGRPVSIPVLLPGSHKRWRPLVTAESWGSGASSCNAYEYRFERVRIARSPGGRWTPLASGTAFYDPGYSVARRTPASFVASRSTRTENLSRGHVRRFGVLGASEDG